MDENRLVIHHSDCDKRLEAQVEDGYLEVDFYDEDGELEYSIAFEPDDLTRMLGLFNV